MVQKKVTNKQNLDDLLAYKANPSDELKTKIVENNIGLVKRISADYAKQTNIPFEELVQEGSLGLLGAIDHFDCKKGHHFSTYAYECITNEIRSYIRNNIRTVSLPDSIQKDIHRMNETIDRLTQKLGRKPNEEEIAKAMNVSVDNVLDLMLYERGNVLSLESLTENKDFADSSLIERIPDNNLDPKQEAMTKEEMSRLKEAIEKLPLRQREIFCYRYGINCEKMTLKNLSLKYAISIERVRQIASEAKKKIEESIRKPQDSL